MFKRNLLIVLIAATAMSSFAQSNEARNTPASTGIGSGPTASLKPYLEVTPYKPDANAVRIFFSPTCMYSREYLSFFKNLDTTLSAKTAKTTIFTPTTNFVDGINYAMAFAAVRRFHPTYLQNFIEASMTAFQDKHINVFGWAGIETVGAAVGFGKSKQMPESLPLLVSKNKVILYKDVQEYQVAQKALQIIGTPSVAVAGTYVVSPEFTLGDADRFSELINAVVSMTL